MQVMEPLEPLEPLIAMIALIAVQSNGSYVLPVILQMNDIMRISDSNGEYIFNIELK